MHIKNKETRKLAIEIYFKYYCEEYTFRRLGEEYELTKYQAYALYKAFEEEMNRPIKYLR